MTSGRRSTRGKETPILAPVTGPKQMFSMRGSPKSTPPKTTGAKTDAPKTAEPKSTPSISYSSKSLRRALKKSDCSAIVAARNRNWMALTVGTTAVLVKYDTNLNTIEVTEDQSSDDDSGDGVSEEATSAGVAGVAEDTVVEEVTADDDDAALSPGTITVRQIGRKYREDFAATGKTSKKLDTLHALNLSNFRDVKLRKNISVPNYTRATQAESVAMQATGRVNPKPCKRCEEGRGNFVKCVSSELAGNGACGNCHYNSEGSLCTYHNSPEGKRKRTGSGPTTPSKPPPKHVKFEGSTAAQASPAVPVHPRYAAERNPNSAAAALGRSSARYDTASTAQLVGEFSMEMRRVTASRITIPLPPDMSDDALITVSSIFTDISKAIMHELVRRSRNL